MSKIIESTLVTADGVVDNPGEWALPYFNEEFTQEAAELLRGCDAMLMGRGTYDDLAWRWQDRTGVFADEINAIKKYVFSSQLETTDWNNSTVVRGDVVKEVSRIKDETAGNLVMFGHGRLTRTLLENRLVDVLRLAIHPVVVGTRPDTVMASPQTSLTLLSTRARTSGVVVLTYELSGR